VAGNLWIDVEDLFDYARINSRPSGIQRLAFEIYQALLERDGHAGRVHFIRHAASGDRFHTVAWPEVRGLYSALCAAPAAAKPVETAGGFRRARQTFRNLAGHLPASLRPPFIELMVTSFLAAHAWARFISLSMRSLLAGVSRLGRRHTVPGRADGSALTGAPADCSPIEAVVARGDTILVLGSPWSHGDYARLIRGLREEHGVRFAMLVYDLIPLRRPEWCDAGLVRLFANWLEPVMPLCDQIFAISHATADDFTAYARESGIALPRPIITLPIGTGFGAARPAAQESPAQASGMVLPPAGSYALIVSTIEARKNHLLLFRVWRRLIDELPLDEVPNLVFAGRIGWLVDDLMRQISNTANLNGKLTIIEGPTDSDLVALYEGCLFTLFPSFYEGWGLPVTESLALGKPCLISNRTSLPEAGGSLARSFDPDNLNDAYAAIRRVIDDREDLANWEAQVRREFRPIPWSATAEALLEGLEIPSASV
jgi:glycosyltransferase involved in cell wall biosynthesis